MLERFPAEGWKTNVSARSTCCELSAEFGVEHFVNISTDKAADATSVLGSTKRLAETLTAWQAEQTGDAYISVRFGNVLGLARLDARTFNVADRGRRPGDGHPPRRDPLLHDDPRGLRAGRPGRRHRSARRGAGARDGDSP